MRKFGMWLIRMIIIGFFPALIAWVVIKQYDVPPPARIGGQAPTFSLETVGGHTFTLTDHPKKITIINFFTTWCPPCRAESPDLARFIDRYHRQVTLIMIDRREEKGTVESFIRQFHLQRAVVVLDPNDSMAEPYGITGQPETFGISQKGIVEFHIIGPMNESQLVEGLHYIEQHQRV